MAGNRKLFIVHASELAHRLVHLISRGGLVDQFVRSYAQRYSRLKLVADPQRIRELEATIGREALLTVAVEVRRLLPGAFAEGNQGRASEQAQLADAFFAEFVASLGRSLEWPDSDIPAETQALDRDLEMYWRWSRRSPGRMGSMESPFQDRCAILLDPPMMEQARRAAADFEKQVVRLGVRALANLGRLSSQSARKRSVVRTARRKPPEAKSASRTKTPLRRRIHPKSRTSKPVRHPKRAAKAVNKPARRRTPRTVKGRKRPTPRPKRKRGRSHGD